ncbi:phage distal tail protein [Methanoculleus sp. UBA45]|uniref:phage distal tail protein n=1 Tax=Methanoculleus sp. UBA45 TaxID=1915512 RepID=UPI0031BA0415
MTDITIAQAGTWPTYRLTLTRGVDPLPLAGVTATLYAIHARYSGWEIRQPMTVEDAAAGQLLCAFGPEDTVHPGTYNVQVRLLWGDGTSTALPAAGYFQMGIGPALNPVITNATTGESIGLTVDLAPGEWVEIRTAFGAASCRLHDGSSAMGAVQPGSTFWQMQPGDNTLTYADSGGDASVLIQYSPRYTGV